MKRSPVFVGVVAAAAAVGAVAAVWAVPAAIRGFGRASAARSAVRAGDFDLPGMLDTITQNNERIGQVNQQILTSLGDVAEATAGVDRVRQRLSALEGLVQQQGQTMSGLVRVTQDQVALSRQLADLTATVEPATAGMAKTAASEAEALGAMAKTTQSIASKLQGINAVNRTAAAKLQRAEELTAVILDRLP